MARHGPQLIHWVARVPDVRAAVAALAALGIDRGEVIQASRATPNGLLQWQITVRADGQRLFDGCLPTLIQWGDTHPAASMPESGVTLLSLSLRHPDAASPGRRLRRPWADAMPGHSRPGAPERPPANAQGPDRASLRESAFMMHLPDLPEIEAAAQVVYRHFQATPQYRWALLSERLGADCWVKHENHTPVGAFKIRGGLTYFDQLAQRGALPREVISATRGNHGQSIGWAARAHGVACTIVVPHGNSLEKNAAMRALGVTLIEHGDDFQESREHASNWPQHAARTWCRAFTPR